MIYLSYIVFISWALLGVIVLSGKTISKFEYALVWVILMVNLLANIITITVGVE